MRMMTAGLCLVLLGAAFIAFTHFKRQPETRSYTTLTAPGSNDQKLGLFISGHSLTDRPMPDFLADIAKNAGLPIAWDQQQLGGSSVRQRSVGAEGEAAGAGFAAGMDRKGNAIDVRKEFQHPSLPGGKPYDVLLITEQHRLLDSLLWQDSLGSLRAFQDTFIAANAAGTSYVFIPWLDFSDASDPSEWIAYERSAWPLWLCAIASVNDGLAAEGRSDRLSIVPASLALAGLVEHLSGTPDIAGFEGLGTEDRIAALFGDRVHLTPLGNYYIAAITFAAIYGHPIVGDTPPGLDPAQAGTLKAFAETFVARFRQNSPSFGAGCRSGVHFAFAVRYAAYIQNVFGRKERGPVLSRLHQMRDTLRYAWRLRDALPRTSVAENPKSASR
jgi:hypothetical protein